MKKTLLILTLTLLLFAACALPAAAATYYDTPGHWAEEAIEEWSDQEIIIGFQGYFRPDDSITRGEMATILDRIFLFQDVAENPFRDLDPNEWYAEPILKCSERGILLGYDGLVRPTDTITREEAAAVITRALGYYYKNTSYRPAYADNADISDWAWNNVAWLTEHGYITDSPTYFRPRTPITRAETMVLLDNLIDLLWRYNGLYNTDIDGTVVITAPRVMFINSHISGDVIVAGGSTKKVILCNCRLDGEVLNTAGAEVQVGDENAIDTVIFAGNELPVQYGAKINRLRGGDCFINDRGRLDYRGGYVAHGIDVSEWQHEIDWPAVAADGIDFAIIRCGYRGYTAGKLLPDAMFYQNIEGALAAGLDVGVYIYSQAISEEEAREEARMAVEMAGDYDLTYPIVFDWEYAGAASARTNDTSREQLTSYALAFCDEVESLGYTPCVYSYGSLSYHNYDLAALNDYYMWFAGYYEEPEFFYHYDIWQYTSSGQVDGIEGNVDMNLSFVQF
ncbi:MAG: S-layer homology domain-containing protein [Firmicutes bacterium]|nr:S-layer homology domain-containing protein [Bacillota bacterium]